MKFYSIYQIDEQTWRIEDIFRCYMYLLEGEREAVLIDTGMGLPGLSDNVKELTSKPVSVITTHGHLDHIGGNSQFEKRYMMKEDQNTMNEHADRVYRKKIIESFVQELNLNLSEKELEELTQTGGCLPYIPLVDGQIFDLGNRKLQVIATPGHTVGSICILDLERKDLFAADTVCDFGILLFFTHSAAVSEYEKSIRKLEAIRPKIHRIWPGHHTTPLDAGYLAQYRECARQILMEPEAGEDIVSNLGRGKVMYKNRISITY